MNEWFGLGIALELRDRMSSGLETARNSFDRFKNSMQQGTQDIKQQMNELNNLQFTGALLRDSGSMITGLGTSLLNPVINLGKQVVSTSSQFEQWRQTLKALYNDADVATQKLQWGMNLAAKTPFDVDDVTEALIGFKAVGAEADKTFKSATGETRSFLEYMGDLASLRPDIGLQGVLMGVRNLLGGDGGRSLKMRMDIDLETILGRDFGSSTEEIMQDLVTVSDKLAHGLMTELEGTWEQMVSNLEDQATRLFLSIGDNGAFDVFKNSLKGFSDIVDEIDDDKMKKIGKNIADAFKMIWTPIDIVIKGLQTLSKWFIKLAESDSVFAKLVLGATTLVGSILALTGVMLTFGGGLIQTVSSLGLFLLTLQTSPIKFTGILSSLKVLMGRILPLIALMGALAVAWKKDFLGIRTTMTNFTNTIKTAWSEAKRISSLGVTDMLAELKKLDTKTWGGWLTYNLTRLMVLWDAVCEAWNTNELSDETFQKVQALGLLPLLSAILDMKQRVTSFFDGFKKGWEKVSEVVQKVAGAIGKCLEFILTHLFPVKDGVEDVSDAVGGIDVAKWEKFGEITAYIVSIVGGLFVLSKIIGIIQLVGGAVGKLSIVVKTFFSGMKYGLVLVGTLVKAVLLFFGIVVEAPALLVGAITLAIVAIMALIWTHSETVRTVVANIVAYIVGALVEIALVITGAVMGIITIIMTIVGAITTIIVTIVGIITTVLVSIVALITSGVLVIYGIVDTIITAIGVIIAGLMAVVSTVITFISGFFQTGFAFIQAIIETFLAIATALFTGDFSTLSETLSQIWTAFGTKVSSIWSTVMDSVRAIWDTFKGYLTSAWESLSSTWSWIMESISGIATNTVSAIKGVWDGIGTFFSDLWGTIMGSAEKMFTWLGEKFSWVSSIITKIKGAISGIDKDVAEAEVTVNSKPVERMTGSMIGLNTGGYVKDEGVALLHPNEVVVNDDLTQQLRGFLQSPELALSKGISESKSSLNQADYSTQRAVTKANVSSNISNDNSVVFSDGAIQISLQSGTEADATKLAKMIMEKIKKETQLRSTLNYNAI